MLDAYRQMPGKDENDLLDHEMLFPDELAFLWTWFSDLHTTRRYAVGMESTTPLPITFAEIEAWSRLHGIDVLPWHIAALRRLDTLAVTAMTQQK